MNTPFEPNNQALLQLLCEWEPKLLSLCHDVLTNRRNGQGRTVKQILGHMIDSASNNTHRIVHLQYQPSPLIFPDYASDGNNDRWIAIQDYQNESWGDLVALWSAANRHLVHVIRNVNDEKLSNEWIAASGERVSLRSMIDDYLRHFELHLSQIEELINNDTMETKKEILFVLLNDFADWEGAYIASSLNCGVEPGSESQYVVKTVAPTKEPVVSMGGFKVLPDYGINDIPADYAGLIFIGGTQWFTPEASLFVPLVKAAVESRKLVAGICNASVFLGMHGILNDVRHTSNGIDYLKQFAGTSYTGDANYVNEPAVRSGNIITANGFSALEFCREILYALDADTPKKIERSYRMNKTGVWENPETE